MVGGVSTLRERGNESLHLPQQAVEFQILQARAEGIGVHRSQAQVWIVRQGNVHQNFRQFSGQIGVVVIVAKLALQGAFDRAAAGFGTLCLHLGERHVNGIEIAVFLEQIDRRFGAHPPYTGDVVGAVSGEGLEVNNLLRHHPKLAQYPLFVDQGRAAVFGVGTTTHVEDGDVALVIHQLEQVAIPGEDPHAPAFRRTALCKRPQHVIRLITRGHAKG